MGQEAICTCKHGRRISQGKSLLETDALIFRGDFRLSIPLKTITSVTANDGELQIASPEGSVVLTLGPAASKWADKILHPPSRLDKLGVKTAHRVWLIGKFDADFLAELATREVDLRDRKTSDCDLIFLAAKKQTDLKKLTSLIASLKPSGGIWIVYPRGVKVITESDVIAAGRKAGLKDVKVTRFSETHTALKFVIPVNARSTK